MTEQNNDDISDLLNKANSSKRNGRSELDKLQEQNNKSETEKQHKPGRKNVYFSTRALKALDKIEDLDGVGMSKAVQAALELLSSSSSEERIEVYERLGIDYK